MTLAELKDRMSMWERRLWAEQFIHENAERESARQRAKAQAKATNGG